MSRLDRIFKEQAAQVLSFGAAILDRLLLTAVLYRFWGPSAFEIWSTVLAVSGVLTFFELGMNLYTSNRISHEIESGNTPGAERVYATSNFILIMLATFCTSSLMFWISWTGNLTSVGLSNDGSTIGFVLLMASSSILRIPVCGTYALYRGNRQYARLVTILSGGELIRILGLCLVAISGFGILAAALANAIFIAVVQIAIVLWDAKRRFLPFAYPIAVPTRDEIMHAGRVSLGYSAQNIPVVLLTHAPVISLADPKYGIGAISTFVLLRTMTGLPRALLQSLGIVFGQEVGRTLSRREQEATSSAVDKSARLMAALSGCAGGFILATGQALGTAWTGNSTLVTFPMLAAGVASMVIVPLVPLAHNILASTNKPFLAAVGRWTQLVITFVLIWLLPIDEVPLRMLASLTVAEIVGYAPFAYYDVNQLVRSATLSFHIRYAALSVLACSISFALSAGIVALVPAEMYVLQLLTVLMGFGIILMPIWWLGFDASTRAILYSRASSSAASRRSGS